MLTGAAALPDDPLVEADLLRHWHALSGVVQPRRLARLAAPWVRRRCRKPD